MLVERAAGLGVRVLVKTDAAGECLLHLDQHVVVDLAEARQHLAALEAHVTTFVAV
ncbi:hypothetical protein [Methylibium sp.]|uniref:hypothetical protein n=1 Tax=Methylibium sp. TaxID=2067992 RepID=UPI002DB7B862|nr:hypothetical protein [Methylibium sp.]